MDNRTFFQFVITPVLIAVSLISFMVLLSSCQPPTQDEIAKWNSNDSETGIVGTLDGCTVYRMANHGPGTDYVFFTKCETGEVTTNFQYQTGSKHKTTHDVQIPTVQEEGP